MTTPNFDDHFKTFIGQLEKSLSLAEWGELANPLNKSAKIFRVLQDLSASFPSLEISNDCLRQNASRIFESNIGVIGIMFQFRANKFSEFDRVCGKLAKFLPELKAAANLPSHTEVSEFNPDSEFGQNLTLYLRNVINAMNYIYEILPFFKIALFACNEPIFCTQEYAKASLEFTDIVTMLEFKSVSVCEQTSGNSLLEGFFNTLNRPSEIAMSALWLLFTFPTVENLKFDIILDLCNRAVSIFVYAVGILNDLTWFLLKDFVMLKAVRDELREKFQLVIQYCNQILELKPSDASVLKELEHCKTYVISNNTILKSVDILEETEENSAVNSTVSLKDTQCNCGTTNNIQGNSVVKPAGHTKGSKNVNDLKFYTVATLERMLTTSVLKSTVNVNDVNSICVDIPTESQRTSAPELAMDASTISPNSHDPNFNIADASEEAHATFVPKSSVKVKDANCISVADSEETPSNSAQKSIENVEDTNCNSCVSEQTQETFTLISSVIVKDTNCSSVSISKQTQETFTPKLSAIVKDTNCNIIANSKVTPLKPKNFVPKPVMNMEDINCESISEKTQNTCVLKPSVKKKDTNSSSVATSKKTPKTSTIKPVVKIKSKISSSVATSKKTPKTLVVKSSGKVKNNNDSSVAMCKKTQETFAQISLEKVKNPNCFKETPTTSAVKSTINVDSAIVVKDSCGTSPSHPSSPFLDLLDVKFDSLTLKQRKTFDKVINSYNRHVNDLSFSVTIAESEFQVLCKICGQNFLAENVEKHLSNECQSQNSMKSNDSQEVCALTPVNHALSASVIPCGPGVWFLDITDVQYDSLAPKQRGILEELIQTVNYHTNHFSFAVKVLESELQAVWCKFCDAAFLPEKIEEHIEDLNHRRSIYEICKRSPKTRAAVPQISEENWKFLKLAPGGQHMCFCSLCGQNMSLSVNAWIQHFQSFWHRKELKKLNDLSRSGQTEIFKGLFNPGKVRLHAERHQAVNSWGEKSTCTKVPPYLETSPANRSVCGSVLPYRKTGPANGEVFNKLFSPGKMQFQADRYKTANLWGPRHLYSTVPPQAVSNPAKGGVFSKIFSPKGLQNEAGRGQTASFNARVALYVKPKISTSPEIGRSSSNAVGLWHHFNYHVQNMAQNILPSTASNSAESTSQPDNESQSQGFFKMWF